MEITETRKYFGYTIFKILGSPAYFVSKEEPKGNELEFDTLREAKEFIRSDKDRPASQEIERARETIVKALETVVRPVTISGAILQVSAERQAVLQARKDRRKQKRPSSFVRHGRRIVRA